MEKIRYKGKNYPIKNLYVRFAPTSKEYEFDKDTHCYTIAPESLFEALCEGSDDGTIITDDDGEAEDIDALIYHYVEDEVFHNEPDEVIAADYLDEPFYIVNDEDII